MLRLLTRHETPSPTPGSSLWDPQQGRLMNTFPQSVLSVSAPPMWVELSQPLTYQSFVPNHASRVKGAGLPFLNQCFILPSVLAVLMFETGKFWVRASKRPSRRWVNFHWPKGTKVVRLTNQWAETKQSLACEDAEKMLLESIPGKKNQLYLELTYLFPLFIFQRIPESLRGREYLQAFSPLIP